MLDEDRNANEQEIREALRKVITTALNTRAVVDGLISKIGKERLNEVGPPWGQMLMSAIHTMCEAAVTELLAGMEVGVSQATSLMLKNNYAVSAAGKRGDHSLVKELHGDYLAPTDYWTITVRPRLKVLQDAVEQRIQHARAGCGWSRHVPQRCRPGRPMVAHPR